ncbi:MAG: 16S rRNA (adenine(1518)-N(6)/adenine(1519)-N(6))-dimethyltransferase RsmA [Pyrodictiaceae archaeon]
MEECRPKRKRLGQHFLVDRSIVERVVEEVCRHRRILELGAGPGTFSIPIANCSEQVIGIELDPSLVQCCHRRGILLGNLTAIVSDLRYLPVRLDYFDLIFGSIPYNLTSYVLELLVKEYQGKAILIVQREVARRLAAKPGTKSYGRLTILVREVYDVKLGKVIPPYAFNPPPQVYSQLIILKPRRKVSTRFIRCLEEVTACLFSQRRKLSRKVIGSCLPTKIIEEIAAIKPVILSKRVYQLTLDEIEVITKLYCG